MSMTKAHNGFADYTWNLITGRCEYDCIFCNNHRRFLDPPKIMERQLRTNLGVRNVILVGSSIDMFSPKIPSEWIQKTLDYCRTYPLNTYIFQSKNPKRFLDFDFPKNSILGTVLETNRSTSKFSKAPSPSRRFYWMSKPLTIKESKFIAIDPIMKFDLEKLVEWIQLISPEFVSIGADIRPLNITFSRSEHLPEPTLEEINRLIHELNKFTIVKTKPSLNRLLKNAGNQ